MPATATDVPQIAVRPTQGQVEVKWSGRGVVDVTGGARDIFVPTHAAFEYPALTGGGTSEDTSEVTSTSTERSARSALLRSALDAIQSGLLMPPAELDDLLDRVVALRDSLCDDDVEEWADRLGGEASRLRG